MPQPNYHFLDLYLQHDCRQQVQSFADVMNFPYFVPEGTVAHLCVCVCVLYSMQVSTNNLFILLFLTTCPWESIYDHEHLL